MEKAGGQAWGTWREQGMGPGAHWAWQADGTCAWVVPRWSLQTPCLEKTTALPYSILWGAGAAPRRALRGVPLGPGLSLQCPRTDLSRPPHCHHRVSQMRGSRSR